MNETQTTQLDRAVLARRNDFLKLLDLLAMPPVTIQNVRAAMMLAHDLKDDLPFDNERALLYAHDALNCDEWLEKAEGVE